MLTGTAAPLTSRTCPISLSRQTPGFPAATSAPLCARHSWAFPRADQDSSARIRRPTQKLNFAGGSPTTAYGVTAGLLRLRTAGVNLDWQILPAHRPGTHRSFPLCPDLLRDHAEPAMSWSGNLWVWTPQIEVEHRIALRPHSFLVFARRNCSTRLRRSAAFSGNVATAERPPGFQRLPTHRHRSYVDGSLPIQHWPRGLRSPAPTIKRRGPREKTVEDKTRRSVDKRP